MAYYPAKDVLCPKMKSITSKIMHKTDVYGLLIDGGNEHATSVTIALFEDDSGKRPLVGIRRNGCGSNNDSSYSGSPKRGRYPAWLLFELESLDQLIDELLNLKAELNQRGIKTC